MGRFSSHTNRKRNFGRYRLDRRDGQYGFPDVEPGWYKFYAFVLPEALAPGWNRDRIKSAIQAEGVPCDTGTCPEMYREQAFADLDMRPAGRLPVAMDLGLRSLFFQVHTALRPADMEDVVAAVRKVMAVATA